VYRDTGKGEVFPVHEWRLMDQWRWSSTNS